MELGSRPRYVMFDGKLVGYGDARLHVLSPALKYGIAVFEGFCGYWNEADQELYTFRMQDHLRRLRASLDMAALDYPGDVADLQADVHRLIAANGFRQDVHMRLQIFLVSDNGQPEDTGPVATSRTEAGPAAATGSTMARRQRRFCPNERTSARRS